MRIESHLGSFRKIVRETRQRVTGHLTEEERQVVLGELNQNREIAYFAGTMSELLCPSDYGRLLQSTFPEKDHKVIRNRLPFELLTDGAKRHLLDLTRNADKIINS